MRAALTLEQVLTRPRVSDGRAVIEARQRVADCERRLAECRAELAAHLAERGSRPGDGSDQPELFRAGEANLFEG